MCSQHLLMSLLSYHPQLMQPEAKQGAKKNLAKATECFSFVINRAPSNVYAAQGIGAVLAEEGQAQAALTIFTQVGARLRRTCSWLAPCVCMLSGMDGAPAHLQLGHFRSREAHPRNPSPEADVSCTCA